MREGQLLPIKILPLFTKGFILEVDKKSKGELANLGKLTLKMTEVEGR